MRSQSLGAESQEVRLDEGEFGSQWLPGAQKGFQQRIDVIKTELKSYLAELCRTN